jgi:succinate dehydrogenase / fumarate reductase cytochrome b subunit
MNIFTLLFKSSLGKKFVMAVSGAGLFCFLIGHLLGNLQIFLPPEAINRYAHFLQSTPELLWSARLGLLALVALHVWSAIQLSLENRASRPVRYAIDPARQSASVASRTMLGTGSIIAAFIVYHLLHYTVRVEAINGSPIDFHSLKDAATGHNDVYAMVIAGFQVWYVSLFYIIAIGLLCLHLSHGIKSMFQSLGLMNRSYRGIIDKAAPVIAALLFLGYASIPAAVLFLGHGNDHLTALRSGSPATTPSHEVTK